MGTLPAGTPEVRFPGGQVLPDSQGVEVLEAWGGREVAHGQAEAFAPVGQSLAIGGQNLGLVKGEPFFLHPPPAPILQDEAGPFGFTGQFFDEDSQLLLRGHRIGLATYIAENPTIFNDVLFQDQDGGDRGGIRGGATLGQGKAQGQRPGESPKHGGNLSRVLLKVCEKPHRPVQGFLLLLGEIAGLAYGEVP
ncbi:hypothetical protein HRbin38_00406 [bacterium HR38]|nr:hypothetical protein HRbin38_00406 [bacterium HR38]